MTRNVLKGILRNNPTCAYKERQLSTYLDSANFTLQMPASHGHSQREGKYDKMLRFMSNLEISNVEINNGSEVK